jgi:hypothetical protein
MAVDSTPAAMNGDHDPADYASCPRCRNQTFRATVPTAAGIVIVYICDACDAAGPRVFIPHLERFERRGAVDLKGDPDLHDLLKMAKATDH